MSAIDRADLDDEKWEPDVPIPVAPMFEAPPMPIGVLRFFAWKQFWPGGAMYIAFAWVCWWYATPELASMETFEPRWLAFLWLRNAALVTVLAGTLHWWLYCLLYTSPSPRDRQKSRMPSSA